MIRSRPTGRLFRVVVSVVEARWFSARASLIPGASSDMVWRAYSNEGGRRDAFRGYLFGDGQQVSTTASKNGSMAATRRPWLIALANRPG